MDGLGPQLFPDWEDSARRFRVSGHFSPSSAAWKMCRARCWRVSRPGQPTNILCNPLLWTKRKALEGVPDELVDGEQEVFYLE